MLTTAILNSCNCTIMLQIGNVANALSSYAEQPIIVWDIVSYRGTQILKMSSGRKVCKKW